MVDGAVPRIGSRPSARQADGQGLAAGVERQQTLPKSRRNGQAASQTLQPAFMPHSQDTAGEAILWRRREEPPAPPPPFLDSDRPPLQDELPADSTQRESNLSTRQQHEAEMSPSASSHENGHLPMSLKPPAANQTPVMLSDDMPVGEFPSTHGNKAGLDRMGKQGLEPARHKSHSSSEDTMLWDNFEPRPLERQKPVTQRR